jgi:antitoxin ParD1/3/4
MTIKLRPEDEQLIQKRLESGAFATPEEVIHRALESLQADEDWLHENRAAIHDKIERAFGQFERGEGLTPEESLAQLEAKKVCRRA